MPTFSAIALDRLIEPGATKMSSSIKPEAEAAPDVKLERRNSTPSRIIAGEDSSRPVPVPRRPSVPPPRPKLVRGNSTSSPSTMAAAEATAEKKAPHGPQISPALYATPETTPLPDSPTSFPPSPYIINHKKRGPRLQKSSSEASVLMEKLFDEKLGNGHLSDLAVETNVSCSEDVAGDPNLVEEEKSNGVHWEMDMKVNGNGLVAEENGEEKLVATPSLVKRVREADDFFGPQESMSFISNTDGGDFSAERSARMTTPMAEFYDAWEELSSDSGCQPHSSIYDLEAELREMRISLLMEIEKRKQAEDAANNMRKQWQVLRQKLREVGLVPSSMDEDAAIDVDCAEEICQQVNIARFVSESMGRAAAKAECEEEMEAQVEWKNFEIARLCDRLHYYETMNREMTRRNQEAIELARRDRQRRKRIQKWIWGSVGATITIGTAALAWSYIQSSKGSSSSSDHLHSPESNSHTK